MPHPEYGRITQVGRTVNPSKAPGPAITQAHEIGTDNPQVLGSLLGYTAKQMDELEAAGVFG